MQRPNQAENSRPVNEASQYPEAAQIHSPQLSRLPHGLIFRPRANSVAALSQDSIGNADQRPLQPERPFNPEIGSSNATTNQDSVERANLLNQFQSDPMFNLLLQEEDSDEAEQEDAGDSSWGSF